MGNKARGLDPRIVPRQQIQLCEEFLSALHRADCSTAQEWLAGSWGSDRLEDYSAGRRATSGG